MNGLKKMYFYEASREQHFDNLLQDGQDAAVVHADAPLQQLPHQQDLKNRRATKNITYAPNDNEYNPSKLH